MGSRALSRCYNIADLERLARRKLPKPFWDYLAGGSDDEVTLRRSTAAFNRYELLPRYLIDVTKIDTSTTVLGSRIEWPVFLAPTGVTRLFHTDGERAVARAAHRHGTIYSLSTMGTTTIEDVGAATPGPKCFQIYVLKDRGLTKEYIERCRAAGYTALCLTVDLPQPGNRERDWRSGMTIPPRMTLSSLVDIALHPGWVWRFLTQPRIEFKNLTTAWSTEEQRKAGNVIQYFSKQFDRTVTWDAAEWMASEWGGPFAIKGILTPEDAKRAAAIGATAVMISTHGGRQLDGVPAPIDMIVEVVDAVGDRIEVILDGGVRRGTHVLAALAMGAKACMIGRSYLFGLAAGGEAGVDRALTLLRAEVERGFALIGWQSVRDANRSYIRPSPTPIP
ncbi:MAG TPA: alpha-hydroxy acid oxidase [Steroidobacteraceae bacterium]